MNCYNHPERDAVATCSVCGKAICSECAVDVGGKLSCKQCLAAGRSSSGPAIPAVPRNKMALSSMLLGIGGWVFWVLLLCFNFTIGSVLTFATYGIGAICLIPLALVPYLGWVPAVITGHIALKQLQEEGNEEQGRGMAITGLILGYLAIGISIILVLLVIILSIIMGGLPIVLEMFSGN